MERKSLNLILKRMQPYGNPSKDAGVSHFSLGTDFIALRFKDDPVYLYNYAKTGEREIETMKELAQNGDGLTTYVNKFVKDRYAEKLL